MKQLVSVGSQGVFRPGVATRTNLRGDVIFIQAILSTTSTEMYYDVMRERAAMVVAERSQPSPSLPRSHTLSYPMSSWTHRFRDFSTITETMASCHENF